MASMQQQLLMLLEQLTRKLPSTSTPTTTSSTTGTLPASKPLHQAQEQLLLRNEVHEPTAGTTATSYHAGHMRQRPQRLQRRINRAGSVTCADVAANGLRLWALLLVIGVAFMAKLTLAQSGCLGIGSDRGACTAARCRWDGDRCMPNAPPSASRGEHRTRSL